MGKRLKFELGGRVGWKLRSRQFGVRGPVPAFPRGGATFPFGGAVVVSSAGERGTETFDEGVIEKRKESGSAAGESGDKAPQSKWSEASPRWTLRFGNVTQ